MPQYISLETRNVDCPLHKTAVLMKVIRFRSNQELIELFGTDNRRFIKENGERLHPERVEYWFTCGLCYPHTIRITKDLHTRLLKGDVSKEEWRRFIRSVWERKFGKR